MAEQNGNGNRLNATTIYRSLTAGALVVISGLLSTMYFEKNSKLDKISDSLEKVGGIITDVRIKVTEIQGEQSRLKQVDADYGDRISRMERACERSRGGL